MISSLSVTDGDSCEQAIVWMRITIVKKICAVAGDTRSILFFEAERFGNHGCCIRGSIFPPLRLIPTVQIRLTIKGIFQIRTSMAINKIR